MALEIGDLFFQLRADTKGLISANKAAEKFTKDTTNKFKRVEGASNSLSRALTRLITAEAIRRTVLFTDQFRLLEQRVKIATKQFGSFNRVFSSLKKTSIETGTALEANVTLFQALARTADDIGATEEQVLKLVDAVSKLGVIGGSSSQDIKFALRQLSQGLAAGILRAEEFNSIVENTPEVANAIAKGLGTSVGQLRLAVLEGKVLSEDVFKALLSQSGEIDKTFSEVTIGIGGATQSLLTGAGSFLNKINKTTGITESLSNLFVDIGKSLNNSTILVAKISIFILKIKQAALVLKDIFGNQLPTLLAQLTATISEKVPDSVEDMFKKSNVQMGPGIYLSVREADALEKLSGLGKSFKNLAKDAANLVIPGSFSKSLETANVAGDQLSKNLEKVGDKIKDIKSATKTDLPVMSPNIGTPEEKPVPAIDKIAEIDRAANQMRLDSAIETGEQILEIQEMINQLRLEGEANYLDKSLQQQDEAEKRRQQLAEKARKERDKQESIAAFFGLKFDKQIGELSLKQKAETFRGLIDRAAQYSKEFFAIQKALALSQALIEAPAAILSSYQWGASVGGPILGAISAAAATAATAVYVQDIAGSNFQGRQGGGPVGSNSAFRVNETGPELLTVGGDDFLLTGSQPGQITPANQISAGGSGQKSMNVTVNNNAPVEVAVNELDQDSIEIVINSIDEGLSRRIGSGVSETGSMLQQLFGLNPALGGTI